MRCDGILAGVDVGKPDFVWSELKGVKQRPGARLSGDDDPNLSWRLCTVSTSSLRPPLLWLTVVLCFLRLMLVCRLVVHTWCKILGELLESGTCKFCGIALGGIMG